jgi:hypothetical protein
MLVEQLVDERRVIHLLVNAAMHQKQAGLAHGYARLVSLGLAPAICTSPVEAHVGRPVRATGDVVTWFERALFIGWRFGG